jgi:glycerol-3-phosphate dehydrogenase
VSKYGDRSMLIAQLTAENIAMKNRLLPGMPYTYAELQYVLDYEMAYTVKDVIARRWGTQLADWHQALQLIPEVGTFMSSYFHWSSQQEEIYIRQYERELAQMIAASNE